MKIRVLIVDDEVHARRGLKSLLDTQPDVEIIGQVGNGQLAIEAIRRSRPDLVFLDVEMPGRNGIEVIAEVGADVMPAVIFVTAFDQYAVAAFEANAIDYLLKPFTDERFAAALDRARRKFKIHGDDNLGQRLKRLLDTMNGGDETLTRFTVRTGDVMSVFNVDDIDWIEADEYYAKLHIDGRVHMIRQTMQSLDEQLPSSKFARIHRSTIVNLNRVVALEPMFQGDYTVILRDGVRLKMSRRRREVLRDVLKTFS